jgi:ADP-ribose pyrophosphatase YjhB (NUDIX family)
MKNHRLVTRTLVQDQHNRFLLVRNPDQDFWYPPGGGVEVGEALVEAAIREVLEETGAKVRIKRLLFVLEFCEARLDVHNVEFFFLGALEGITSTDAELDSRWFEQSELLDNRSVFPKCLREPDWGGALRASQNLYFGLERA